MLNWSNIWPVCRKHCTPARFSPHSLLAVFFPPGHRLGAAVSIVVRLTDWFIVIAGLKAVDLYQSVWSCLVWRRLLRKLSSQFDPVCLERCRVAEQHLSSKVSWQETGHMRTSWGSLLCFIFDTVNRFECLSPRAWGLVLSAWLQINPHKEF